MVVFSNYNWVEVVFGTGQLFGSFLARPKLLGSKLTLFPLISVWDQKFNIIFPKNLKHPKKTRHNVCSNKCWFVSSDLRMPSKWRLSFKGKVSLKFLVAMRKSRELESLIKWKQGQKCNWSGAEDIKTSSSSSLRIVTTRDL